MRRMYQAFAMLAVLAATGSTPADDKTAAESGLASLEPFVGEWEVNGNWSDGSRLQARSVYEWGLGKKILKARTFGRKGDKEHQRYERVLAWHPEKKSLFEISFAYDGGVSEFLIESKDKDTLHIGWMSFVPDKPSNVRQVIKFLDRDHFQWVVSVKDGETWKQLIDATWTRKRK
jgi:hypothetical protein